MPVTAATPTCCGSGSTAASASDRPDSSIRCIAQKAPGLGDQLCLAEPVACRDADDDPLDAAAELLSEAGGDLARRASVENGGDLIGGDGEHAFGVCQAAGQFVPAGQLRVAGNGGHQAGGDRRGGTPVLSGQLVQ